VYTGFWCGNLRKGDHFGDLELDWRIILKRIFKHWDVDMDWILDLKLSLLHGV
jgi:hypothetical protein